MTHQRSWQLQPLEEYQPPQMPTTESLRGKFSTSWKRAFKFLQKDDEEPNRELGQLSRDLLTDLVPEFDWVDHLASLDEKVNAAREASRPDFCMTVIVGPPGSGIQEVLNLWAERESGEILPSPAIAKLLADKPLIDDPADSVRPLVVPALHNYFLRHPAGLAALRKVLSVLLTQRRPVVLGCDSWAWAYLRKSVNIDAVLPEPLTPEPLCGQILQQRLADFYHAGPHQFRFAKSKAPLWNDERGGRPTDDDARDEDQTKFFDCLASTARGIPGVAVDLWVNCLRTAPNGEPATAAAEPHGAARQQTIWVEPSALQDLPRAHTKVSRQDAITAHLMLVQAGLPEEMLLELLPFSPDCIQRSLFRLRKRGLAVQRQGVWSIAELAYANVRAFLKDESFLIDDC